jgi:hypothetical protein
MLKRRRFLFMAAMPSPSSALASALGLCDTNEPAEPTLIVLSDNAPALRVIQQLLAADYPLVAVWVAPLEGAASPSVALPDLATIAMIIVAAIEPETESLVLLGRAGLGCLIGQVPLLLITERQFSGAAAGPIVGLTYPFTPEALRSSIQALCPHSQKRRSP